MSTSEFTFSTASALSLLHNRDFVNSLSCSLDPNQNESCLDVCGDVREVFLGWPTFYTCSWYPEVSRALEDPSVNQTTTESLAELGVVGHESELSQKISLSIANCLSDYCAYSSDCRRAVSLDECSLSNLLTSNGSTQTLARTSAVACFQHGICSSKVNVDPDIGGIGVLLSLIMQYSISLLAVAIHAWFLTSSSLRQRKIKKNESLPTIPPTGDEDAAAHHLLLKAEKKSLEHRLEPLTSALVEFQKAQCFFSSTLQIAGLIVFTNIVRDGRDRDHLLLKLASANAYSPVALTLVHLRLLGARDSWYVPALSATAFALGTFTFYLSVYRRVGNYDFYSNRAVPVASCAGFAPIAPCFFENDNYATEAWGSYGLALGSDGTGLGVWIVSFVILSVQIIQKFCSVERVRAFWGGDPQVVRIRRALVVSRSRSARLSAIWTWTGSGPRGRMYQAVLKKKWFWLVLQLLAAIGGLVAQLASIIKLLLNSYELVSTSMTFGQIVAVGIWIPVLLEYAYLEYNGAAEGTEYRLKSGLAVVKSHDDDGDDDDSEGDEGDEERDEEEEEENGGGEGREPKNHGAAVRTVTA